MVPLGLNVTYLFPSLFGYAMVIDLTTYHLMLFTSVYAVLSNFMYHYLVYKVTTGEKFYVMLFGHL